MEVRDREDCGSYTEGMSGTDSYDGQVAVVVVVVLWLWLFLMLDMMMSLFLKMIMSMLLFRVSLQPGVPTSARTNVSATSADSAKAPLVATLPTITGTYCSSDHESENIWHPTILYVHCTGLPIQTWAPTQVIDLSPNTGEYNFNSIRRLNTLLQKQIQNTNAANTKKRDKNIVLVAVGLNTGALQTASEMTLEGWEETQLWTQGKDNEKTKSKKWT